MTPTPHLSVVMQVYNVAPYLAEAIESILSQTYRDFEFIIVESGSTDGTVDIIREYARRDTRIRATVIPDRRGRGECLNIGTAESRAPLIAWMHGDDVALPDRFERHLAWMERVDADVCGAHAQEFGTGSDLIAYPESHDGILAEMCFINALFEPTVIVRRELLRAHPYSNAAYEDYELWTRLATRVRMANMPEVVLRHRSHPQQAHRTEKAVWHDLSRYRFSHFYRLYPKTPLPEFVAIARMSDRLPMTSLAELESAGAWLLRLSQPRDRWLHDRMLRRWRRTVALSAALGVSAGAIGDHVEQALVSLAGVAPLTVAGQP